MRTVEIGWNGTRGMFFVVLVLAVIFLDVGRHVDVVDRIIVLRMVSQVGHVGWWDIQIEDFGGPRGSVWTLYMFSFETSRTPAAMFEERFARRYTEDPMNG